MNSTTATPDTMFNVATINLVLCRYRHGLLVIAQVVENIETILVIHDCNFQFYSVYR